MSIKGKAEKEDVNSLIELEEEKVEKRLVKFAERFDDASLNKIPLSFWIKIGIWDLKAICLMANHRNLSALLEKCLAIMSLHDPEDSIVLEMWKFLANLPEKSADYRFEDPLAIKANEQVLRGSTDLLTIGIITGRSIDFPEYAYLRDQAFRKYLALVNNTDQTLYLLSAGVCRPGNFTDSEKRIFGEKLKTTAKSLRDWGLIIYTLSQPYGRLLDKKDFWVYAMEQVRKLADTATETELREVLKTIADTRFHVFPKEHKE